MVIQICRHSKVATLQRSCVCLSTSRNSFLFHLRQTFVWVSIKASFLQRNQSWLEIEASPNFFQFHHHEKNPTSSLAASKSKLLQIASNEISSRLPINVVLFTKIFFVVLSWGIRCTAFAKSIAQHYMGSISNTVHELRSNEIITMALEISRQEKKSLFCERKYPNPILNLGPLGEKHERYFCVMRPPPRHWEGKM